MNTLKRPSMISGKLNNPFRLRSHSFIAASFCLGRFGKDEEPGKNIADVLKRKDAPDWKEQL